MQVNVYGKKPEILAYIHVWACNSMFSISIKKIRFNVAKNRIFEKSKMVDTLSNNYFSTLFVYVCIYVCMYVCMSGWIFKKNYQQL